MSFAEQVHRIKTNIESSYSLLAGAGATIPTKQNSDNLPSTIRTLTSQVQTTDAAKISIVNSPVGQNLGITESMTWEQIMGTFTASSGISVAITEWTGTSSATAKDKDNSSTKTYTSGLVDMSPYSVLQIGYALSRGTPPSHNNGSSKGTAKITVYVKNTDNTTLKSLSKSDDSSGVMTISVASIREKCYIEILYEAVGGYYYKPNNDGRAGMTSSCSTNSYNLII